MAVLTILLPSTKNQLNIAEFTAETKQTQLSELLKQRFFPYLVYKERYGCPSFQFGGRRANVHDCLSCDQLYYKISRLRRNISFLEEYYPHSDVSDEIAELTRLIYAYDNMRSQHSDKNADLYDYHSRKYKGLRVQSEDVFVPDTIPEVSSNTGVEQNVNFVDSTEGEIVKISTLLDSSYYNDGAESALLADFLSRPVPIFAFDWAENDTTTVFSTNPWHAFFNDTRIKKKLDNFAFISCELNVKVVVNASPFYYGAMMMNYEPLKGLRPSTIGTSNGDLIPISQRPHVWLYPQLNAGAKMTLPFFYHKNWLDATVAQDLIDMGTLNFRTYAALQSANGASGTGVDVTVYAWASNVKLTGATVRLAVQARDEYVTDGVISKPASAIAEAAGALSKVPVIGAFATATQMGMKAVSSIASLFGYTNVPVIEDVKPMKSLVFHSLASTEISEPVEKLTLDPKNELTIDPRSVGLPAVDELELKSILGRESYLGQSAWTTAKNGGDLLINCAVGPLLHKRDSQPNGTISQFTPLGYLQYMFNHWRGDIIFRFKVIKSKYHKGRLRVTWDPLGDIVTDAASTTVAFTQIMDIGETDELEVRIPYMQAVAWQSTIQSSEASYFQNTGFTNLTNKLLHNGSITVRVLNALSAPVATSSIDILCFVRAAENFEFANPINLPTWSHFVAQAGDEFVEDGKLSVVASNASSQNDPNRYLVNFGESIKSLRTILRRSCLNYTAAAMLEIGAANSISVNSHMQTRVPLSYGYDPNGIHTAISLITPPDLKNFNFVHVTPYSWIAPMFIGYRGSMIWHYNLDTSDNDRPMSTFRVRRHRGTFGLNKRNEVTAVGNANQNQLSRGFLVGGTPQTDDGIKSAMFGGVAQTNQYTQAGLSALIPMYNRYRFNFSTPTNANYGIAADDSDKDNLAVEIVRFSASGVPSEVLNSQLEKMFSIGTDFNFYFFLNCPSVYIYSAIPT